MTIAIAYYTGVDAQGNAVSASIPVFNKPLNTIQRLGVRLELQKVVSREEIDQEALAS